MNQTHKIVLVILLSLAASLFIGTVSAQSQRVQKADLLFSQMAYPKAASLYKAEITKYPNAADLPRLQSQLALCYERVSQTEQAEAVYQELVGSGEATPQDLYRYALMLRDNGKYEAAKTQFATLKSDATLGEKAQKAVEGCDFAMSQQDQTERYKIQPQVFNTTGSEFGAAPMNGKRLVTSARRRAFFTRATDARSGNLFYDLYEVEKTTSGKGYSLKPLKGKVNTRFHEGPGILSPDGTSLFFTRSNYFEGKRKKDETGINNLKIFTATREGIKWKNIQGMPFNSDDYSSGHPALSPDGNVLVFASDRPGGQGGTDLYRCEKTDKGWSTPMNLGRSINTSEDELFPTFDADGNLYFSSKGHAGMGGLDVFSCRLGESGWEAPQNAGYPLNSSRDDFGVYLHKNGSKGYFSSNRPGGSGGDDVYFFTRKMLLEGVITDVRTGAPIPNAKVTLRTTSGRPQQLTADAEGKFSTFTDWGREIMVSTEAEGFLPDQEKVDTRQVGPLEDLSLPIALESDLKFVAKGIVRDKITGKVIPHPTLRVTTRNSKDRKRGTETGGYSTALEENTEYTLILSAKGYKPAFIDLSTVDLEEAKEFVNDVELERGNYVLVEGLTRDRATGEPVAQTRVVACDADSVARLSTHSSSKNARYFMLVPPDKPDFLLAAHSGYFTTRVDFPAEMDSTWADTTLQLDVDLVKYEVGAIVKVIYYDLDQSFIRKRAAIDLLEIVYFLENNPDASVELSAHTDSRASDSYNDRLSTRRAQAAVDYIVEQGIDPARIRARGYGEKRLTNRCSNGVPCSEPEHQDNRRTEIEVIKIEPGISGTSRTNFPNYRP